MDLQAQVVGYTDIARFNLSDLIGAHKEGDVLYVRSHLGETPVVYSTIQPSLEVNFKTQSPKTMI